MIYDSRMTVAYIWKKADILIFRPSFFLGNLGRVDYITEYEYDLFIRPDTCNPRFRVWFNFTVENVKQDQVVILGIFCFVFCIGWVYFLVNNEQMYFYFSMFLFQRVIFNIVNFSKTKSLYRDGMSPLVKSTSRQKWFVFDEMVIWHVYISINDLIITVCTLIMTYCKVLHFFENQLQG